MAAPPPPPPEAPTETVAPGGYEEDRAGGESGTADTVATEQSEASSVSSDGMLRVSELQSWLPSVNADVVTIQEAQFSAKTTVRIPGFQPPVVTRRERGRNAGAAGAAPS